LFLKNIVNGQLCVISALFSIASVGQHACLCEFLHWLEVIEENILSECNKKAISKEKRRKK
jgi:hypothetical protein